MRKVIYYRDSLFPKEELDAARKYFTCVPLLAHLKEGDFVIPRYSMYPFYRDQEREIRERGAVPVNSLSEHTYVADLINWYFDLKEFTPETWTRLEDIPEEGPFILKGETNSRKSDFNRFMFARDKKEAIIVHSRLLDDSLIGQQKIYIRQYVPLKSYYKAIGGLPVTKEFRFFVCKGKIVSSGFYWSNHVEELKERGFEVPYPSEVPTDFLRRIIDKVRDSISFFALDVAQKENGDWIVIELNDGCQAGLSEHDPEVFYRNLSEALI